MWQVIYNPSVVVAPRSGGNVSSGGFKRRLFTNTSPTAGRKVYGNKHSKREAGGIALSADWRILSAVKRAGLFYRLKLCTLFFSN